MNQGRGQRPSGNRKVLDGALGLSSVIRKRRDLDFSHRIAFGSHFGCRFRVEIGCHRFNLSRWVRYDSGSSNFDQYERQLFATKGVSGSC
jgi:hypothetical protein